MYTIEQRRANLAAARQKPRHIPRPSPRAKIVFDKIFNDKELSDKGGVRKSVSRAMLEAGYSKETAKTPAKLTDTDNWKYLMQEYLPDSLLAKKHKELLNKREVIFITNEEGKKQKVDLGLDVQATFRGLDMAYKLKKRYGDEQGSGNKILIVMPAAIIDKNATKEVVKEVVNEVPQQAPLEVKAPQEA